VRPAAKPSSEATDGAAPPSKKPPQGTPGSAHGPGDLFAGRFMDAGAFDFADTLRTIFRYIPVNLA
ncbi:MAG: hypothetical protein ACP5M5_08355, partial [Acidibrevibacterium sp.]|uniref:hypothetical protein n=1 Tax=Acidibrevibacterium sp. TaxID=2606776 RepID=UPI003D0578DF